MSSFTTTTNDSQNRTQRRLLFEGFNVPEPVNSSRRHHSTTTTMFTSTPDHKLHEKETEHFDLIPTNDSQPSEPCLLQLQNARQLLHTMSRTNTLPPNEQPLIDNQQPPTELFSETNPELAYYKSSLESERNRRKQLETLIDVQQQRLSETESELIQLRANDHKKSLCMKQLEQMIPNVVDEWKQKENDYKIKLNSLTQQIKQLEQTNREKYLSDKQQFDEQLNEKSLIIERLNKDNERYKQDYETIQTKTKQNEQRIQQLTKDSDQAKQRWSTLETDLRNEIKTHETRLNDIQSELDKKQQEIELMLRDQHKLNSDHQVKIRQLENELDEQRRENNVLKMELELREAKYRAQTESLKIQLMRDAETKLTQSFDEQHRKHLQIEEELNELHHRKLSDLEEKHEQILLNQRHEHENRVQVLVNKLDQMKNEIEQMQSTTIAERQDLAKKLQDVFETALFKGTTKATFPLNQITNSSSSPPTATTITSSSSSSLPINQLTDTQIKGINMEYPTNISTIRSLSSRIDSLVDQTNRVANGFELIPRLPLSSQQETPSQWIDNSNRLLSSQSHSELHSPFYRSTPIDPLQEYYSQLNNNHLTTRSQSVDPTTSGLFSIYPQLQQSSNSLSLDNHFHQSGLSSHRSTSSIEQHQQSDIQTIISKDSIEKQQNDQTSLSKYVKMLLERSPTQDNNTSKKHPLAKTNQSLHDIQLSIDQLNFAERDSKTIVDDLVLHNESQTLTPRPHKSSTTNQTSNGTAGAKKRLDYDINNNNNNNKQTNTSELFERLSQPKARIKKDKPKQQQQQQQQQQQSTSTGGHGIWK